MMYVAYSQVSMYPQIERERAGTAAGMTRREMSIKPMGKMLKAGESECMRGGGNSQNCS